MATKFLEPGGDADFAVAMTTGFWAAVTGTTLVTDFVHGNHIKSLKHPAGGDALDTQNGTLSDSGSRISFWIYVVARPSVGTSTFFRLSKSDGFTDVVLARMTTGGVLQLANGNTEAQIGSNGATLSIGVWYRISLAYTITSSVVNRLELFVNGVSSISVTNATITDIVTSFLEIGNINSNAAFDFRTSDHYIDNSSALTDPGNIWVTAKRPNANGTTNGFSTQIGSGGSGYGTGHSPQVNERPLSNTNGWSMIGAGSAVTEEYNIESTSTGDIDISTATIVDWLGWVDTKALVGETVQIILDGANNAQAITSTETLYTKIKGSTTYPSGTGADIGMTTDTSLTTVSLYECGVIVAYIPATASTVINNLSLLGAGV